VRKVTVSIAEDVHRRARIRAAELGKSLSSLVAEFLLLEQETEFARLKAKQQRVQSEIRRFRASDHLSRDEFHARAVH
jgi:hypothetical protein